MTTEELVHRRATRTITTVNDLAAAGDLFESDTEHDEFLADLYASRRAAIE